MDLMSQLAAKGYVIGCSETINAIVELALGPLQDRQDLIPHLTDPDRNTHSGRYGLQDFPWHTDGAISDAPPRWVVLTCLANEARADTELYLPNSNQLAILNNVVLRTQNSLGHVRYLPAVSELEGNNIVRWDPRACPPTNPQVVDIFDKVKPTVSISWQVGQTLLFDNFRLLHRRTKVTHGQQRMLRREYVF
jgi:hypothetical protein